MPRNSRRNRLVSESASTDHHHHHEPLKGILKNARIPTKRSVSECVDDLSHLIEDLDISIDHLRSGRFCPLHPFPEESEYDHDSCDDDDADEEDDFEDDYDENESGDEHKEELIEVEQDIDKQNGNYVIKNERNEKKLIKNQDGDNIDGPNNQNIVMKHEENDNDEGDQQQKRSSSFLEHKKKLKGCACYDRYRSDSSDGSTNSDTNNQPRKKSVRFDDRVYETVYIASRLYDRRTIAKYRLSTRHHPPANGNSKHNNKKQPKKHVTATLSKSETKTPRPTITSKSKQKSSSTSTAISNDQKSVDSTDSSQTTSKINHVCRQTKSQRAKQSKKDKLKRKLHRKDESCSSDDQGYGSSILNFSD